MPLSEITSALQIFLGSQYVNDFDFNNRAYRVYVQADQQFRADPQRLEQFYVRDRDGQMVPLEQRRPHAARRRRRRSSATSTCSARPRSTARRRPGVSSGQALAGDGARSRTQTLPQGMSYAWSGMSLEEIKAGQPVGRDLRPRRCCSST